MQTLTITEIHARVALMESEYDWSAGPEWQHAVWTLRVDHALDVADTWPQLDDLFIDFNA